jgi:isocitrate dehydrogenase
MTEAQITTARNKYWLPKNYNGSAWVDMTASTRGDVNGDGSVNISDVTTLIDLLLGGGSISNPAADCNQDSSVNISDVTALIDYLLSNHW